MKKKQVRAILIFILLFFCLSVVLIGFEYRSTQKVRQRYHAIAQNQASIIQGRIEVALARAYTLRSHTLSSNGNTDYFDLISKQLYEETLEVSNISLKNFAIAPDGIVSMIYPLEGNESFLGFNFMDPTKEGNKEAIECYHNGEMVITNPFSLVQGGTGFAGRLPVFLPKEDGSSEFWGLVTITIDFDHFIESLHLDNLQNMGVNYELGYFDENNTPVVMTGTQISLKTPEIYSFPIYNLNWYLKVAPEDGWFDRIEIIIGILFIAGLSAILSLLILTRFRLKESNEKLERLAFYDSLTSCYSRHYINTILVNKSTGEWHDPRMKYSVALIDIDYFKKINDGYGHEAGDEALQNVAMVLRNSCKKEDGDCVIRHGGDEFLLLLSDVTLSRFESILGNIVKGVQDIHIPNYPDMRLSISVGGEFYREENEYNFYKALEEADKALYESKEAGRNRYTINSSGKEV